MDIDSRKTFETIFKFPIETWQNNHWKGSISCANKSLKEQKGTNCFLNECFSWKKKAQMNLNNCT